MDDTDRTRPRKSLLDDPRFVGAAMKSLYSSSAVSVERGDQTRVITHEGCEPAAEAPAPVLKADDANSNGGGNEAAPVRAAPRLVFTRTDTAALRNDPEPSSEAYGSGIRPVPFVTRSEPPPPFHRRDPELMPLDAIGVETPRPSSSGAILFWVLTLASFFGLAYLLSP